MESIERVEINGRRYYRVTLNDVVIGTYPSMTTILGNTKDQSGLQEWRDSIGHEEADRISNLSMNRGTIMHRLLELYKGLEGTPNQRLSQLIFISKTDLEVNQFNEDPLGETWLKAGWEFFLKFWTHHPEFFDRVVKVLAAEKFIWSGRGYAGTLDNASEMVGNKILIIDYKNSRKPKRDDWIEDYFCQIAGYAIAFWERTGIVPNGGEVWIANELEDKPQIFTLTQSDLKHYFKEFMKRLNQYNEENKTDEEK
jgi:genome maintenance exonuclease 1